MKMNAN